MSEMKLSWKYVKEKSGQWVHIELAKALNCTLPEDYDQIAIQYNGGRPSKNIIVVDKTEYSFRRMLRVDSNDNENVIEVYKSIEEFNPKLFPFGDDAFGNYFCFDCSIHCALPVVFFDHETAQISFVAGSFSEFLCLLK